MVCDDDNGTALASPVKLKKSLVNAAEHEADGDGNMVGLGL